MVFSGQMALVDAPKDKRYLYLAISKVYHGYHGLSNIYSGDRRRVTPCCHACRLYESDKLALHTCSTCRRKICSVCWHDDYMVCYECVDRNMCEIFESYPYI